MRAVVFGLTGLLMVAGTTAALADPVDGRSARRALFSPRGAVIEVVPQDFLSESDQATLALIGDTLQYYGAVAMFPDEGLLSQVNVLAANYHSVEAASQAALNACNENRAGAGTPCAIVAYVWPRRFEEGAAVQLSQSATEAFRADYGRNGPRSLAVSAASGQFAIASGDNAVDDAITSCNAETEGATDCIIVIQD